MTMHVELVSPEAILYSGDAEMVSCRTTDGEIAFLTGHAPFLGDLAEGDVLIRQTGGVDQTIHIQGGFVEVKDDKVIILSDAAELA